MRIISKFIFVLTLFLTFQSAHASHLLGGEITWQCSGNGNYIFTLTLYRDCNGIPLSTATQSINNPFGANIQCPFVSQTDVSPDCYDPANQITCATNGEPGAVERYIYRSAAIPLNGTPAVGGSEFSWSSCCRPGGNQNTNTGGYYLRARMYPYTAPGATAPNNLSTCYDSSPIFAEGGSPVICTGYNFTYNHLAADSDLDSTHFSWASPLQSAGTPIVWNAGYSNAAPFPDASEDASNGPITLDGVSGEVTMLVNSFGSGGTVQGSFASCVSIQAWRDCQLIAEVFRDVAISIRDDCPVNNQPSAEIDTAVYPWIERNGNIYRTKLFPYDQLKFDLQAQDFDFLPNGSPQSITFEAGGLQVSSPLSSGSGCLGSGTCAKFTPIAPQTGFTQGLQNSIEFDWTPDCGHLGTVGNGCGGITSTYYFTLKMRDDGCPAPAVAITTLIVDVIPGDPTAPPLTSIFEEANGDISIYWNQALQDSGLAFNYYKIFGATNINGPYSVLDSIVEIDSLTTTSLVSLGYTSFYMIKSTGACDFLSDPSDTLSLITLGMGVMPPAPNSEIATLTWNPLHDPLPSTSVASYEIWLRTVSTPWRQVGSVPEVTGVPANYSYTFVDTVSVCDDTVTYQIRVLDTENGFISGSTYQTAVFSDKSNADIMKIDSVSVDSITGRMLMSWQPTAFDDVVEYFVLFNDPINGWTYVDTLDINTLTLPYSWDGSMADQRSEQYKIVSKDSCLNVSDELVVVTHNTINLRSSLNPCEGYVNLSWNYYNGFDGGTAEYNVYLRADNGAGFGPPTLLFAGSSADSSHLHSNLAAGTRYMYYVQAEDTSGLFTSTSNPIYVDADVPQKSRILYIANVTNNYNRGSIDLKAFVDGQADISGFDIERSTERFGIYEKIGNIAKPTTIPYVINFSDFSADPTTTYYYRIRSNNLCGGTDTITESVINLVLNTSPNVNLSNTLSWPSYINWGGGVGRYEIYRSVNDNQNYSLIGSTGGTDTLYIDQIAQFGEESGKFCYYVKAIEDNNPLGFVDDNGEPFSSLSNQVCKNQKVRVYVPTAFRPGSDVEVNRTFGPSLRFEDIQEYDFYVLNRWGAVMFRTEDPTEFWDGKVDGGEIAPTGVYVYFLKFSTLEDVTQEERGTFTLVN